MTVDIGPLQEVWGDGGGCTYSIEMTHPGLHRRRVIKSSDHNVASAKVQAQAARWNEQWARKQSIESRTRTREPQDEQAASMTADAQQAIESLRGLLAAALTRNDAIDWSTLKDTKGFPIPAPRQPALPAAPKPNTAPRPPERSSFEPRLGILDRRFASRRSRKEAEADAAFRAAMAAWKNEKSQIGAANAAATTAHSVRVAEIKHEHAKALASWEAEREEYYSKQAAANQAIDEFRERYFSGDAGALLEYCDMVLSNSEYQECLPQEFDLDFSPETGILLVDYKLPAPGDLPTVVEVRYAQATNTFSEKCLTESQATRLYDDVLYQISLRTVHELFEADQTSAIKSIVFSGFVTSTGEGTGQTATSCVLSVQVARATFDQIDLGKVDPKTCFRQLRGAGGPRLHSLTPIPPVHEMTR